RVLHLSAWTNIVATVHKTPTGRGAQALSGDARMCAIFYALAELELPTISSPRRVEQSPSAEATTSGANRVLLALRGRFVPRALEPAPPSPSFALPLPRSGDMRLRPSPPGEHHSSRSYHPPSEGPDSPRSPDCEGHFRDAVSGRGNGHAQRGRDG